MGTAKFRVGIMDSRVINPGAGDRVLWLGEPTAPNDWETFVTQRMAMPIGGQLMASWVKVLASRYECVVVERVEVVHG